MFPYRLGTYVFPTNVYVPEVYRERTYHLYGHPSRVHRALSRSEPDTTYNFSTLRTTGRLDDGPQTVEQLIRQGYLSIPNSEPETAVISDRKSTSWMGLDNAIAQIRGRQQIYRANIDAIDQSMCDAVNELYGHEAAQGHTATDGQRRTLAQRLQDLSEEKRLAGEALGLTEEVLEQAWAPHAPLLHTPRVAKAGRLIVAGLADRICPPDQALALYEHWERPAIHWFPGTHLVPIGRRATRARMERHLRETLLAEPVPEPLPLTRFRQGPEEAPPGRDG